MRSIRQKRAGKDDASKNFGLSQADFDELVLRLKQGDDHLFRQVFLAHFQECMDFLKGRHGASHQDAYDMTMEALLEFCHQLKANKISYGNLRYLLTRMAAQRYQRWKKGEQAYVQVEGLEIAYEEDPTPQMKRAFDQAWKRLGEPCRDLIGRFYYDKMTLRKLAELMAKSETATRKRKQRCMQSLQEICQSIYQI